jgi:hypothetical protein
LLHKSNGAFALIVWGEGGSGADKVVVKFGESHSTVKIYDVTAGTAPVQILSNVISVPLVVTDHAFVLEVID